MTQSFEDPASFLAYLEKSIPQLTQTPPDAKDQLLQASAMAIRQMIDNQNQLAGMIYQLVDTLNQADISWGQRLSQVYEIVGAGHVDPQTFEEILKKELSV
jgi:hypothetical protein